MPLSFKTRYSKFKRNYKKYLNLQSNEADEIYNHKLDLIELYCFIYQLQLTTSEISTILDISVDTAEYESHETPDERDQIEVKLQFYISLLEYRKSLFEDKYPFEINDDCSLKLKDSLSNQNKMYLVLLACSNLNRFKDFTTPLTKDFEKITFYAIRNMFKDNLIIHEFGKNTAFEGNSREKLKKIGNELNIPYRETQINSIPLKASQDKGIDIIAWVPFKDKKTNMLTFFVQCASGRNWEHKLNENKKIHTYLDTFSLQKIHAISIPFELSTPGLLFEYLDIIESSENMLFDRSRLLEYIKENETVTDSFKLIDKILQETSFVYE